MEASSSFRAREAPGWEARFLSGPSVPRPECCAECLLPVASLGLPPEESEVWASACQILASSHCAELPYLLPSSSCQRRKQHFQLEGNVLWGSSVWGRGPGTLLPAWPQPSLNAATRDRLPGPHSHGTKWTVPSHRPAAGRALMWMEFWGFLILMPFLTG